MSEEWTDLKNAFRSLPAPSAETCCGIFTQNTVSLRGIQDTVLLSLSDMPFGGHDTGWYLYWLIFIDSQKIDPRVLRKKNYICSRKTIDRYLEGRSPVVIRRYITVLQAKPAPRQLDHPAILRYDSLLRTGLSTEAEAFLQQRSSQILSEFFGLAFVRVVLTDKSEDRLWMLSKQPTA